MNEKDDKSFIQTSAYLADRLFDIMCDSVEIPSADLLCLSFQTNQEIYYALIKLNYQNRRRTRWYKNYCYEKH